MRARRDFSLKRPGTVLSCFLLCTLSGATAAPQVTATAVDSAGVYRLRITGKGFLQVKSITVTCSYDPLRVNIDEGTVSSPLSSTALGANLDTLQKTLALTLAAASTISPADGSTLAIIRAPECVFGNMIHAIQLDSAAATDISGKPFMVQIVDGGTSIRAFLPNQPAAVAANRNGMCRVISLNGRCCFGARNLLASGCRIIIGGTANLAQHTGTVIFLSHQ